MTFISLRPSLHALKEMYGSSYFEERQEYFIGQASVAGTGSAKTETLEEFRYVIQLLKKFGTTGKLLDVGCGTGVFLTLARDAGFDPCGVELSHYAVRFATEQLGLNVIEGTLREAALPAESCQTITMLDVFEHLPNPVEELDEVYRLLCPGGILLINTPNEQALLRKLARFFYVSTFGKFDYPVEKLYHEYHLFSYSRDSLVRILTRSGFEIRFIKTKPMIGLKGRVSPLTRKALRALGWVETWLGMQYELLIVAAKPESRAR